MNEIERISSLERKYLDDFLNGQFKSATSYSMVTALEKKFADKFQVNHAVAMVNGTCTLHIALEAAGVGIGDEVICPPLTMSSTSLAVLMANAVPVFADVDPETFLLSPESVRKKITVRTKAIIPVALYGLTPDYDEIMKIAGEYGLTVIEDNAQCFEGTYKGRLAGGLGHMASFSFQTSKHMTCGEGGMLITNDDELALKIRRYSGLGYAGITPGKGRITRDEIQDPEYERHLVLGWNYRMSDLCGAVALGQLERLDELVGARVRAAGHLLEAVEGCTWLKPQKVPEGSRHVYWCLPLLLDTEKVGWREFRGKFMELGGDGIYGAWKLSYMEPAFRNHAFLGREKLVEAFGDYPYGPGLCPVAEDLQPRILQFKTDYWKEADAVRQADILRKTIDFFC